MDNIANTKGNGSADVLFEIPKESSDSPLFLLSHIIPGVDFICLNPDKSSTELYTMQIINEGEIYKGEGKSKKEAKTAVAKSLCEEKYGVVFTYTAKPDNSVPKPIPETTTKNSICFLYEFRPETTFECLNPDTDITEGTIFQMQCNVDGKSFLGCARTKKTAKMNAASSACTSIFPKLKFINNGSKKTTDNTEGESPMIILNNNYPGDFQVLAERIEITPDQDDYEFYAQQCSSKSSKPSKLAVPEPAASDDTAADAPAEDPLQPKNIQITECTVVISLTEPERRFVSRHAIPKTARREAARIAVESLTSSGELSARIQYHMERRATSKINSYMPGSRNQGGGFNRKRGVGCEEIFNGNRAVTMLTQHMGGREIYEAHGYDPVSGGFKTSVYCDQTVFTGVGRDDITARQQAALIAVNGLNVGGSKKRRQLDGYGSNGGKSTTNIAQSARSKNQNFWKKGGVISNDGSTWGNHQKQQNQQQQQHNQQQQGGRGGLGANNGSWNNGSAGFQGNRNANQNGYNNQQSFNDNGYNQQSQNGYMQNTFAQGDNVGFNQSQSQGNYANNDTGNFNQQAGFNQQQQQIQQQLQHQQQLQQQQLQLQQQQQQQQPPLPPASQNNPNSAAPSAGFSNQKQDPSYQNQQYFQQQNDANNAANYAAQSAQSTGNALANASYQDNSWGTNQPDQTYSSNQNWQY